MKIRLLKHAQVGNKLRPKGWEGEVEASLGQSVINDHRAIEIGGAPARKTAAKKKTPRKAPAGD